MIMFIIQTLGFNWIFFHVCRAERAPATNLLVCALRYLTPGVASPQPESNECLCPTDEQKTTKKACLSAASEHRAAAPQRTEGEAVWVSQFGLRGCCAEQNNKRLAGAGGGSSASSLLMLPSSRLAAEVALFDGHTLENAPLSPVGSRLTAGRPRQTPGRRLSVCFRR